jgi:pimeloyl-ACP methyl ester carboxylesterase
LLVATLLVIAVVVVVLVAAHVAYWRRRFFVEVEYEHEQILDTDDGCAIVLRRLPRPEGSVAAASVPVLMVHGLAANHRNSDLVADHSMARYLRASGRDVWLVTLRSGHAMRTWRARARVRFDHMVEHDVPLAIREVLHRTGASQVDYIGYSMGGMLAYATVANADVCELVRRVVIIGSPPVLRVPWPLRGVMKLAAWLPRTIVPTIHMRFVAIAFAVVSDLVFTPFHRLLAGDRSVIRRGLVPRAMVSVAADIPGPLAADFCGWQAAHGGHVTYRNTPVLDLLPGAEMPALFIAGAIDPLGRVDAMRTAFESWGAAEKQFLVLGRANGSRHDYSHADMILSQHAPEEVFEPITRFLLPA